MELGPVLNPVRDLGEFIRDQRTTAQISLRQLAAKAGVSNPYLSQVERGLRKPSADILAQIAHGLQISVESLLTKAGILEHGDDVPDVITAVNADPLLTERQKSSLLEIYRAFRREALLAAPATPTAVEPESAASATHITATTN
ncbi:XRE family transcriptional regulator [Nakamurella antarctica]|uniref:XRE family transcriptional regulator n=1 Tax=Nakamurella antarctica TaxID=1902245 RepID=A0A3G8ZQ44_9ACTN|nr:helix-turn-helix transcriptional regulator [Nakamurella antarctica]AZI58925.1 XRE family transcriptional regulator [Nakamurella antarctica]